MKQICFLALALSVPVIVSGCGGGSGPSKAARNAALVVDNSLVDATNAFGFRLYDQLAASDSKQNLFISPPSIELALAMTLNGAQNSTLSGIKSTLGLDLMHIDDVNRTNAQLLSLLANPDSKVDLQIANAIWTQKGLTFEPGFLQRNKESYSAAVQTVQFTDPDTAKTINQWASDHTLGAIKQIVTAEDIKDDIIELTNAVYFKGPWTEPFDPKLTTDGEFTKLDGTVKTLPMMQKTAQIEYQENDLFQAVRLPYGSKYLSMTVLLPRPDKSIENLVAGLQTQKWSAWSSGFHPQELWLRLPRFNADYGTSLKSPLSTLGMAVAFDPDHANFGGMFAAGSILPGNVFLTHVFHKTYLSVDEKGTTAGAVTDVGGGATSAPPSMIVNRPFFVIISDGPTGVILFMGSIVDPK